MPFFKVNKSKNENRLSPSTLNSLVPTTEIIVQATSAGADLGLGNPNERIRYFIKLGLLPHTVKKLQSTINDQRSTLNNPVGHLPAWTIDRLVEITSLNKKGLTFPQIAEKLKKSNLAAEVQSSPIISPVINQIENPAIIVKLGSSSHEKDLNKKLASHEENLKKFVETKLKEQAQVVSNLDIGTNLAANRTFRVPVAAVAAIAIFSLIGSTIFIGSKQLGLSLGSRDSSKQQEVATNFAKSGQVLAATSDDYRLYIDANMEVTGTSLFEENITAPNVIYSVTGGTGINVTAGQNPVVSLDSTAFVTSVNNSAGAITLQGSGSTTVSESNGTITISSTSGSTDEDDTLSDVTGRGSTTSTALTLNGAITAGSTLTLNGAATLASSVAIGTGTATTASGTGDLFVSDDIEIDGAIILGTSAGTSGQCLLSAGTDTNPTWGSCSGGGGGMTFTLSADSGTDQTISDTNTLEVAGGAGLTSATSATDTVTLTVGDGDGIAVATDSIAFSCTEVEGTDIDCSSNDITLESTINTVTSITSASSLLLNSTSADLSLSTTTSGNINATTAAASGLFNILTGNLKVGNGTPDVSLNGEDAYIEGTLEVDGAITLDGTLTANGDVVIGNSATDALTVTSEIRGASPFSFEGSTNDNTYTVFAITDPTATRTITFPNASGTVAVSASSPISLSAAGDISCSACVSSSTTLFTLDGDDASTEDILSGNTLLIAGGTNGIDTDVSATDTITLNLDYTEIDSATFGTGSGFTWTYNAGATDPTIAFASNQITIGSAATLTATAVTDFDCTDCIDFDDIGDNLTLDAPLIITNGGLGITINDSSATTGDVLLVTATTLTSGSALEINGSSSSGNTSGLIKVIGDVGSNGSGIIVDTDFSGSTVTGNGIKITASDTTSNANTGYGLFSSITHGTTGNANKIGVSVYGVSNSSSTTADTTYGGYFIGSQSGVTTTGTKTAYGVYGVGAALLGNGGSSNVFGAVFSGSGDSSSGTSTVYGIYASATGGDNNYAGVFENGNVGIGDTSPSELLSVGSGDLFKVSSLGNVTSNFSQLDGSSQANGAGSASSSLILDDASNFDVGNYIRLTRAAGNCSGSVTVCYAKITAKATNTLTISPGLSWSDDDAVVEFNIPELGGTNTASTLTNRFGRLYSISGMVVGNSTTSYLEGEVTTNQTTFNLVNSGATTLNIGGAATAISIGASTGTTTINNQLVVSSANATTVNGTLDANGVVTLGDGGDAITIDGSSVAIQTTGAGSDITINAVDQIVLPDFTSDGGIFYADGSGNLRQVTAGTGSQCLLGGTTPSFGSCSAGGGMTSFTLSGDTGSDQTIADGNTVEIAGGTNGIDTVGTATDSVVLNLDYTEIGDATFGSGSGFAWTFDAGATDPILTFASNSLTISSANLNANTGFDVDDAFVVADGGVLTTSQTANFDGSADFDGAVDLGTAVTIPDTDITFSGATTTFTTTGDLTIDSGGGDVIFANADTLNIGGNADDVAFNAIGDDTVNAGSVNSDNDLYIEDDLEVDGTIFGAITGNVTGSATDLSCTDCINATEIEDIYLLNTGDTGSGTFAFTGQLDLGDGGDAITVNGATTLTFQVASTSELLVTSANTTPGTAEGNSLGSATVEWEQLFLGDGNGVAYGTGQEVSSFYNTTNDVLSFSSALDATQDTDYALYTFAVSNDNGSVTANQEVFEIGRQANDDSEAAWVELFALDEDGDLTIAGSATASSFVGALTGNASTATALAANGANCSAGSGALGVDASGAAESCTDFEEDLANSAGLAAALSDETGSAGGGLVVFNNSPTIISPTITTSPTATGATWTDLGTVTTADINGGTIDGTVIGGASAAAGTFTTLTASSTLTANGIFNIGDGGDAGTISSTTLDIDATGALQINSSGGAIGIGNDAVAQAINLGTGAAARTITVGNNTTTTALALTSGTGDITLTSTDDIQLTPSDDILATFAAGSQFVIDATTTANTTTAGVIDINITSATNNNSGLNLSYTNTATASANMYGNYNAISSSQGLGNGITQYTFAGWFSNSKSANETVANNSLVQGFYGIYGGAFYSDSSSTGGDTSTRSMYGGYFTATGNTEGTSSSYGVYSEALTADTNIGVYSNVTASTSNYGLLTNGTVSANLGNQSVAGLKAVDFSLVNSSSSTAYGLYGHFQNNLTEATGTGYGAFINVAGGSLTSGTSTIYGVASNLYLADGTTGTGSAAFFNTTSDFNDAGMTSYSGIFTNTHTAAISSGTKNIYGVYSNTSEAVANTGGTVNHLALTGIASYTGNPTSGTQNVYGAYLVANAGSNTATTTNTYGTYSLITGSKSTDANTVSNFGSYVNLTEGSYFGTSNNYGYSASISAGADNNYGLHVVLTQSSLPTTLIGSSHSLTISTGLPVSYGTYTDIIDTTVGNFAGTSSTNYGEYINIAVTGNANVSKLAYGVYANLSNDNTTTDQGTRTTYAGVFSAAGSTRGTSLTYGVYTTASGADNNYGSFTNMTNSSTTLYGMYGNYNIVSHTGANTSGTKTVYGNLITATATGANITTAHSRAYGVYSLATGSQDHASGNSSALAGVFSATGGTGGTGNAYGLYATAASADNNYGIYTSVTNAANNYAAYFDTGVTYVNLNTTATTNVLCHTANDVDAATDAEYGIVACSSDAVDYAEQFPTAEGVDYGDVVALGTLIVNPLPGVDRPSPDTQLIKSTTPYQDNVIGIVSDNYSDLTSTGKNRFAASDRPRPVALSGRVPVKVTDEGGPIAVGDLLTTSSTPGYAMKADPLKGTTFAKALNAFSGPGQGEILAFVQMDNRPDLTNFADALQGMDLEASSLNIGAGSTTIDNVGNINTAGDITAEGTLSASGGLFTVDGSGNLNASSLNANSLNISGDALVGGNLSVNGELKTNNLTALAGQDLSISLGDNAGSNSLKILDSINNELLTINSAGKLSLATVDASFNIPAGYICVNDSGTCSVASPVNGTIYADNFSTTGTADLAEYFPTTSDEIEDGDLVAVDPNNSENIIKANQVYQSTLLGIISTTPGFSLNSTEVNGKPLALAGRVPTKVNSQNGQIKAGDPITSSSTPGVGMKATQAGRVIGIALEDFGGNQALGQVGSAESLVSGSIIVFVNPSWYTGASLAQNGSFVSSFSSVSSVPNTLASNVNANGTLASNQPQTINDEQIAELVREEVSQQIETLISTGRLLPTSSQSSVDSSQISAPIPTPEVAGATTSEPFEASDSSAPSESSVSAAIQSGEEITTDTQKTLETMNDLLSATNVKLDTLNVTGSTNLANVQAAGTFSQDGTFVIDYGRQLNVLANTLYLQNDPYAGNDEGVLIDIGNGRFTFDRTGNLSIQGELSTNKLVTNELTFDTSNTNAKSTGTATLARGKTQTTIFTTLVKPNAKILITPTTPTGGKQLYVSTKSEFEGFTVTLDGLAATSTIEFDWLIVNTSTISQR